MTRASISSRICLLIALVVGTQSLAQSGSTQSSGSPPTPNLASTQAATAPASGTYSIEAEIFAYKSLAANSAQIATDAATRLPALTTEMPTRGVVIVPSVSTILPAFQVWRSNMLVIQNFLNQAANLPSSAAFGCPTQLHSALAPSFVTSATAVSQTVGVIQSIISLFANNQSITEYPGTIQDQALITTVARQLRAKNTEVLAPDLFAPWNIDAAYPSNSPFVTNLAALIDRLMHLQDLYQCNQITLNAASQLQQAETTRAADFAKLTDSTLTPATRTALVTEIRTMKAQIDFFRQKLGLDTVSNPQITGPENDTMTTELPILANANSSAAQMANALAAVRRNDAGIIGTFENPIVTAATLTAAKAQSLVTGIQAYLAGLTGGAVSLPAPTAATPAAQATASAGTPAAPAATASAASPSATPAATPSPSASSTASSTPPILAVLQADGLARRMGVPAVAATSPADAWLFKPWRILWVKSMESGGAIVMTSNIFGSHPHFSGGAISGYALFQLDGTLVCSGNAGAYGGFVDPKHFVKGGAPVVQMLPLGPSCGADGN